MNSPIPLRKCKNEMKNSNCNGYAFETVTTALGICVRMCVYGCVLCAHYVRHMFESWECVFNN